MTDSLMYHIYGIFVYFLIYPPQDLHGPLLVENPATDLMIFVCNWHLMPRLMLFKINLKSILCASFQNGDVMMIIALSALITVMWTAAMNVSHQYAQKTRVENIWLSVTQIPVGFPVENQEATHSLVKWEEEYRLILCFKGKILSCFKLFK